MLERQRLKIMMLNKLTLAFARKSFGLWDALMEVYMNYFLAVFLLFLFGLGINAQDGVILIAHNNYMVGATQNGKWIQATDIPANFGKPSKFIGFDSFKNGEKPSEIYGTLRQTGCGANEFYFGKAAKVPENESWDNGLKPILAIGANANWNLMPRTVRKILLTNKTYQKIALDFLKTKRINAKSVKLETSFFR